LWFNKKTTAKRKEEKSVVMKVPTLVTIVLLCLSFNAAAAIWYVDKDNSGAEDGTAW